MKLAETKRAKEVELEIALKQNALAKVSEVLQAQGRVAVPADELLKLKTDYDKLRSEFDARVASEVGREKGIAENRLKTALTQKDLELTASSAEVKAQVNSLNEKNQLLSKQVADLQGQINAERAARVEEAKARGNAVVNVQSGK